MHFLKNHQKTLLLGLALLFAGAAVLYFMRDNFLHAKIKGIEQSFKEKYHAELTFGDARFAGINTIVLRQIVLVPFDGDTLLNVDSLACQLSLLKLLWGKVKLNELTINGANIALIKNKDTDNFFFLYKTKDKDTLTKKEINYAGKLDALASKIYDRIPYNVAVNHLSVYVKRNKDIFTVNVPVLTVNKGDLNVDSILLKEGKSLNYCQLQGVIHPNKRTIAFSLAAKDSKPVHLDFLEHWKQLKIAFKTLNIAINSFEYAGHQVHVLGNFSANDVVLNHPKLTVNDAIIKNFSLDFNLLAGKENVSLDSASIIQINDIKIHPYFNLLHHPENKEYEVKIRMPDIASTDFFSSLPSGLFDNVNQIKAKGKLAFNLDFYIDTKQPDSLKFSSSFTANHFQIIQFGKTNFTKINEPFEYTPYSYGIPQQTFVVGPDNPLFTPIDQISPYLKSAIINSEDGLFYYHKGFIESAFAQSIAANFKTGQFTRGGSTLTMQLVKNVFLSKNKTIGRKVEEAIIVWLIENNGLSTKDRMYEVYLNIIEWGPGIYGIGQASRFYFNKKPIDLTLSESIFLTSIIPAPKWFKYAFDGSGKLKEDRQGFFKVLSEILYKKGIISEAQHDDFLPDVRLNGPAKFMLLPKDSIPRDSLLLNEGDLF